MCFSTAKQLKPFRLGNVYCPAFFRESHTPESVHGKPSTPTARNAMIRQSRIIKAKSCR